MNCDRAMSVWKLYKSLNHSNVFDGKVSMSRQFSALHLKRVK